MLQILSALPALSISTKVLCGVGIILMCISVTAYKVHGWTADSYEKKIQAEKVITVVKTLEVKELDQKSLTAALVKQRKQLEQDHANETEILRYLAQRPSVTNPSCDLDDDGLRLWNSENRGVEVP